MPAEDKRFAEPVWLELWFSGSSGVLAFRSILRTFPPPRFPPAIESSAVGEEALTFLSCPKGAAGLELVCYSPSHTYPIFQATQCAAVPNCPTPRPIPPCAEVAAPAGPQRRSLRIWRVLQPGLERPCSGSRRHLSPVRTATRNFSQVGSEARPEGVPQNPARLYTHGPTVRFSPAGMNARQIQVRWSSTRSPPDPHRARLPLSPPEESRSRRVRSPRWLADR